MLLTNQQSDTGENVTSSVDVMSQKTAISNN